MADIQQWRKKIQPSKARTPLEPDDIAESSLQTATPKRCLKKKVSSYFDLGQNTKSSSFHEEAATSHLPAWPVEDLYPDLKAEDDMDSVMCVLMSRPHSGLDVRYNSPLMRIFEGYRKAKEEKLVLEQKLQEATDATQSVVSQYNMAQKDWEDKKQDYKDEIKRLEVLLAKSSTRCLAEVTLARQESKLRSHKFGDGDHKETIFEFLEKTNRYSSRFYDNQRATMKPSHISPSDKDVKWSQKLSQKKSMTNIHADLPFGTPPDGDMRFSLTRASVLEQQAGLKKRRRAVTISTTESDDTFSSFACEGESEALPQVTVSGDGAHYPAVDEELADALAPRWSINPPHVIPRLLEIFDPRTDLETDGLGTSTSTLGITASQLQRSLSTRIVSADSGIVARKTVAARASDLFHRLKPQLGVDNAGNARRLHRRFSFEPGDDAAAPELPLGDGAAGRGKGRVLRKSVSLDMLRKYPPTTTNVDPLLSPVPSSPTVPVTPADGRPPSRIPTPVYSSGCLARPRQEREDSASSLRFTAIRQAGDASQRSNSASSSVYSAPSTKTDDSNLVRVPQATDYTLRPSMYLVESMSSLRNVSTSAAARAGTYEEAQANSTGLRKRPGSRSNRSHSGYSDKNISRFDSLQPMNSGRRTKDPTR